MKNHTKLISGIRNIAMLLYKYFPLPPLSKNSWVFIKLWMKPEAQKDSGFHTRSVLLDTEV